MIQKLNTKKNEKGFTLIELMIVIAIIGILSAIAIPNFLSYRTKGIKAGLESEAKAFYSSAVAYLADTGLTATAIVPSTDDGQGVGYQCDPKFSIGGTGVSMDDDGNLTGAATTFTYKGFTATVDELGTVVITP